MGDVADVGEVEDVGVVAELDVRLVVVVGAQEAGERLDVALAEDARGAEGGGEELGGFLAVGFDDELFGGGLESFDLLVGRQWDAAVSMLQQAMRGDKRNHIPLSLNSTPSAGRP